MTAVLVHTTIKTSFNEPPLRPQLAQSTNWLKRTDRLLYHEAKTSAKNPDTFIFG
jgi:hypothetical protein